MDLRSKISKAPSEPLFINIALSIIAIGLVFLFDANNTALSSTLYFLFSFILFFSAVFSTPILHVLLVIISIGSALLINIPVGNLLRISVFSLMLIPTASHYPSFPRFYIIATMWLVFTAYFKLPSADLLSNQFPPPEILFANAVFEIVIILLMSLIRSQRSLSNLVQAPVQRISALSYVIQLASLLVLLAFMLSCSLVTLLTKITLCELVQAITNTPSRMIIGFAIFIILPSSLSYFITNPLSCFAKQIRNFINASPSGPIPQVESFAIRELNELQELLKSTLSHYQNSLRNAELDLKTLRTTISQREAQAQKREQSGLNLKYLLNKAPSGCIALTTTGIIIDINEIFKSALELEDVDIIDKKYNVIMSKNPWAEEIVGILNWACKEHKSLIGQGSFRFYSSSVNQRYLEIEVHTTQTVDKDLNFGLHQIPTHQVGVVLFFTIHSDIRDYLVSPLNPTRDLILEKYALQICDEIKERLVKITDDITEQKKLVLGARNVDTFDNIRLLAQDIDKLTHDSLNAINRLTPEAKSTDDFKTINITSYIQDCLNHLYDLMSLGRRIQLKDGSSSRLTEKTGALFSTETISSPPPIMAEASASKFASFSVYFLAFIKNILPITTKIDISLATEHIGSGTASILPTTAIGDFARIYIRHAGQSVTPNMTLRTFAEICSSPRPLTSIEIAIALLMWQVKDLGGFVTIQSSAARGTQVTIYIPLNQRGQAEIERKRSGIRPTEFRVPHHKAEGSLPYVLLISPDTEELATFKRMIIHLGYHVTIDNPDDYLAKEDEPIGFGGLGFGETNPSQSEDNDKTKRTTDSPFDIVLVNTNKTFPVNVDSLKQIEEKTPNAQIVVLISSQESVGSEVTKYNVLLKPFDLDDLKRVLEDAITRKLESNTVV